MTAIISNVGRHILVPAHGIFLSGLQGHAFSSFVHFAAIPVRYDSRLPLLHSPFDDGMGFQTVLALLLYSNS